MIGGRKERKEKENKERMRKLVGDEKGWVGGGRWWFGGLEEGCQILFPDLNSFHCLQWSYTNLFSIGETIAESSLVGIG